MSASRETEAKNIEEKDTANSEVKAIPVVDINMMGIYKNDMLSVAIESISKSKLPTFVDLNMSGVRIPDEKALRSLIDFVSHPLVLIREGRFNESNISEIDPKCLLFDVLLGRNNIQELVMYGSYRYPLHIHVMAIFLNQLIRNSSLISLKIGLPNYKDPTHSVGAGRLLRCLLETHQNLTELSFDYLSEDSIIHFSPGLKLNKGLKELSLRGTKIGDKGIQSIMEVLNDNPDQQLQTLDLYRSKIGPEGAKALAKFLENPLCQLRWLDLQENCIGDEGFKAIAESLEKNKSLEILNIWDNKISGNEGALALAKALKANNNLAYFCPYKNKIGIQGMLAIIDSLKLNHSLRNLSFDTKHFGYMTRLFGNVENSLTQVLRISNRTLLHFESTGLDRSESKSELTTLIKGNKEQNTRADYNWRLIAPLIASARTESTLKYAIFSLIPEIMAMAVTPKKESDQWEDLDLVKDKTDFPKINLDRFSRSRFFCSETNPTFFTQRPEASTQCTQPAEHSIEPMEDNYEIKNCRVM